MVDQYSCFTDDEAERKKKKKTRIVGDEARLAPSSRTGYGFENADGVKQSIGAQPDGSYSSKQNPIGDAKVVKKNHLLAVFIFVSFLSSFGSALLFNICTKHIMSSDEDILSSFNCS